MTILSLTPLYSGDDWDVIIYLDEYNPVTGLRADYDASTDTVAASVITAAGVSTIAAVAQSNTGEADWSTGKVQVLIPRASTAIAAGNYILSIQTTTAGGKRSEWQQLIRVKVGAQA